MVSLAMFWCLLFDRRLIISHCCSVRIHSASSMLYLMNCATIDWRGWESLRILNVSCVICCRRSHVVFQLGVSHLTSSLHSLRSTFLDWNVRRCLWFLSTMSLFTWITYLPVCTGVKLKLLWYSLFERGAQRWYQCLGSQRAGSITRTHVWYTVAWDTSYVVMFY